MLRICALFLALLGLAPLAPAAWAREPTPLLIQYQRQTQQALKRSDSHLAEAARRLASTGLAGPHARAVLRVLLKSCPGAVDVCTVDLAGRIVAVEPPSYRHVEGADISGQEQVQRLQRTGKPVMSAVFKTVEGMEAADLERPVLGRGGRLLGSVSVLIRPEALLEGIAAPLLKRRKGLEAWAMEAGGRVLYDHDVPQIGINIFSDPLYEPYPDLLNLARRMASENRGQGSYIFPVKGQGQGQLVFKRCWWLSVEMHGAIWRLALTQVEK